MDDNPCRLCTAETGRHPGCHDHCDKAKEWRKEWDARKARIQKAKDATHMFDAWTYSQRMSKFHGR